MAFSKLIFAAVLAASASVSMAQDVRISPPLLVFLCGIVPVDVPFLVCPDRPPVQ